MRKRKTKDVVCRKCGSKCRIPADKTVATYICMVDYCYGNFKLNKVSS